MAILLIFGILIASLALSIPIGIGLGLSTALTIAMTTNTPLVMIAQNCFASLDSFPLLAIPFFMLAGTLMGSGGISRRLVGFCNGLVGHFIGGLGKVTVAACMFFAAISGSGPATVSAIGSFMIPAMRAQSYKPGFAAALVAAAGTIGVIIPPSIPFVLYGVVASVSVGEMFLAGVVPGIIIGVALMTVTHIIAKRDKYPVMSKEDRNESNTCSFREAFWALMIPVIILGGIYGGIFTPTEAAAVGSAYAIIIGKFVYKELDFKMLWSAFRDAALVNGSTSYMVGFSSSFAVFLTMAQIPAKIGAALLSVSDSKILILLLINALLLVVGCFVDNLSSMIILTPILLPIVTKLGMDPVHFGLVMTCNLAIGFVTPPYGANLFVSSAISGINTIEISRNILPMIAAMLICLLLFTFVPSLSMGLVTLLLR
ncbi:MAG: TRAP transporter large permease [Synergistaceae bacterium]|jgi:C4-dicarboxylate transporter DctM subunit|nr:TRAP transporter large permease [Synergistaceae bacterium]